MKKIWQIIFPICAVATCNIEIGIAKNDCQKFESKVVFENGKDSFFATSGSESYESSSLNLTVKLDYEQIDETIEFRDENSRKLGFEKLKTFYSKKNAELVKSINLDSFSSYYVSKYSPYISIEVDYNELLEHDFNSVYTLANNSNVEMIYVNKNHSSIPNLEGAKAYIGARSYINNNTYTGNGVVVGILEPGIIDKNHSNFVNTNVIVRDEPLYFEKVTEHSTMMASVIAGTYGIAKKAKILSVELSGDAVSEIDWLLDNNVNVINTSYGDENPTGIYSSKSAYMDFIVNTYKVTMVSSAGNSGLTDTNVANPGLAYNAITLGSCNSLSGFARDFSSFNVVEGPRKPNLMAPGSSLNIKPFASTHSGTSFSAAITTGCVALMMERDSTLKLHPERVMSQLLASSSNPSSAYFGNGLDNFVGAGVLNFDRMMKGYINGCIMGFDANRISSKISYALTGGSKFCGVISWLAKSNGTVSGTQFSDYDFYIYNSKGNLVAYEATSADCIEPIEFEVPYDDEYIFEVVRDSAIANDVEYVSFSYFLS